MSTVHASGTLTSTVNTEQTLTTQSTDIGTALPVIDCVNLTAGNYVIIKVKTMTLGSGTTRIQQTRVVNWLEAAVNPIIILDPILSNQEYVLTIQHNVSTSTAFPWKVLGP